MSSKTGDLKLFDNKQLIHIASEVVVLIGLTFYFSSKNKKLLGHVEELAQKLEEQEDHIQKLEASLQQMGQKMDNLIQQMNSGFAQLGQGLTQTNNNFNTLAEQMAKKTMEEGQEDEKPKEPIHSTSKKVVSQSRIQPRTKQQSRPQTQTPQTQTPQTQTPQTLTPQPQTPQTRSTPIPIPAHKTHQLEEIKEPRQQTKVHFNDPPRAPVEESEEDDAEEDLEEELDDSDLDDEIRAELDELDEDDSSLKKEN